MTNPTTGNPMEVQPMSMTDNQSRELQRLTRLDELDQMHRLLEELKRTPTESLSPAARRGMMHGIDTMLECIEARKKALRT